MDVVHIELARRYKILHRMARVCEITGVERLLKLNALFSEVVKLKMDPVMNLSVRVEWFRMLKSKLLEMYPFIKEWDTCNIEDIVRDIRGDAFETGFFVVFGDVSYLGLINKLGGHQQGDVYLKRIAHVFVSRQSERFISGRYGGDEIVSFAHSRSDEEVRDLCEEMELEISSDPYEVNGKVLVPCVDLGRSNLQESLFVLYRLIEEGEGPDLGGRISFILNCLIRIADQRADYYKRIRRIYLLVDLFTRDRLLYEEFVGFMRKGTGNISDKEIEELANEKDSITSDDFKKHIMLYVLAHMTEGTPSLTLSDVIEQELALSIFV